MELIQDNPCSKVQPPKAAKSQKKWYTVEEAVQLVDSLNGAPLKYQAFFNLAIFCGYRREELLGLEWDDLDFSNCLISVNRASLYTKERGVYTDVPKTESSRRILKQPQIVFDVLRRLRAEQAATRLSQVMPKQCPNAFFIKKRNPGILAITRFPGFLLWCG